jgi:integrase
MSALAVRRLQGVGHHCVGGVAGLALQVAESGARTWILRYKVGAKRRDMGLGGYPDVELSEARERARAARALLDQGIDPIDQRQQAKRALAAAQAKKRTFAQCARDYIDVKSPEWTNSKHADQWTSTLAAYATPRIGNIPVGEIEHTHVLDVLKPIWKTKTETAARVRARVEAVLDWATVHEYRSGPNPARWKGHLDKLLPKPSKVRTVVHHKALPVANIPRFMHSLRQQAGTGARALEFAILTAARSGEVRGATWSEIDQEQRLWIVPAERMKAGKEHRCALSKRAIELLHLLPRMADSNLIFPSAKGVALSDMTLAAVLRRMKVGAVPHGFRSTFKDWASETTTYPREVVEMALAHTIGDKVEAAYRRGDLLQKRRELMEDWARFLCLPCGDQVAITLERLERREKFTRT